jgi:hypothetical protein
MALTDIFKGETWGVIRAKLNAAIGQVNTHITTIAEVDNKADTAASDASTALSAAQAADTKAGTALTNAAAADGKADTALTNAATADSKAEAAQTTATSALTAANNADTKAQSVVDALPTKVDKEAGKGLISDTEKENIQEAIGLNKPGYLSSKLTNWRRKLSESPATAKMIFVGDSTSDFISSTGLLIKNHIEQFCIGWGDPLDGFLLANMPNMGSNGNSIKNFYDNPTGTKNLNDVIAAAPDLIVFSYGINDVRVNLMTAQELKAYIINCINAFRQALPNTDIILRMPSSFLIPSTDTFIKQGSYASLAVAAQAQTDILYTAYKELENYWPNVVLWDSQNSVFGRTVQPSSVLMVDEIHSKGDIVVEELIKLIAPSKTISPIKAKALTYTNTLGPGTNYADAYTIDITALDYNEVYLKVIEGRYNTSGSGYLDILCDANKARDLLRVGDIISFGGKQSFKLPLSGVSFLVQTASVLRIINTELPVTGMTKGIMKVYRHKYAGIHALEAYVKNTSSYPYKRAFNLANKANGYIILNTANDYGILLPPVPRLDPSDYLVQNGDVLVFGDGVAVTLTNATFQNFNGSGQLWINMSGTDFSNRIGPVFVFGNHTYELGVDKTLTATGTTGSRTINRQSGTVNIAAGGTSITVTNSLVKAESLVTAIVRTNDSTAVIKNVVCGSGNFTINLTASATAETNIGFILIN